MSQSYHLIPGLTKVLHHSFKNLLKQWSFPGRFSWTSGVQIFITDLGNGTDLRCPMHVPHIKWVWTLFEFLPQQWDRYLESSFSLSAEFKISEQLINVTFDNSRGKHVMYYSINKNLEPGQSSHTMNCRTPSATQRIIKAYLSPSLTAKGRAHMP